ncbi:restriction endonuclease subunit S [Corynebacterium xerosis]|uniref:restriction endonuclease subunit S n=1 Tax=Corynebacterium xerosis TaxID=1725 RepID=UPI000EAEE961|nr:restriction endonuclease subunit S [Corynebacterium xerosis]AYJ32846.1 restriction endonuclease subunit S [Corynebacterium xerosis]
MSTHSRDGGSIISRGHLPKAQLRHYVEIDPPTAELNSVPHGDPVTFMSLDTVWADGHADVSREMKWTGQAHSYTPFRRGDVLLPKVSPTFSMGRATVANIPHNVGLASSEVYVLRPRTNVDSRFVAYAVRTSHFLDEGTASQQGVGGLRRVSSGWVGAFNFPRYDLPTQRRIADYLDRETTQIDAMAGALDGLVARLEERRRAAIIDSFGSIQAPPAHLGAFCDFTSGSGFPVKYQGATDKRYPFYKVGSLSRLDPEGFVDDRSNTVSLDTAVHLGATIVPIGAILMAKIGMAMLLGRYVRTRTECCIDNNMLALAPRPEVADSTYIQYALHLAPVRIFVNPGPVPSLDVTSLRMHSIPLPPLDEQRRIADHLDEETAKIDAMIAKAGALRALLDERRSALITATVTGQHPVPEEP